MLSQVPQVDGQRVRLRAVHADDFDAVFSMGASPLVYQGTSGKANTREEAWLNILKIAGHWSLLGYGSWAVVNKHSLEFLGIAGVFTAHRNLDPDQSISPEVGWAFMPEAHGKGLAQETMKLALAWFHQHHPHPHTYAMINLSNTASARLATRLGYKEINASSYKGSPVTIWKRAHQS